MLTRSFQRYTMGLCRSKGCKATSSKSWRFEKKSAAWTKSDHMRVPGFECPGSSSKSDSPLTYRDSKYFFRKILTPLQITLFFGVPCLLGLCPMVNFFCPFTPFVAFFPPISRTLYAHSTLLFKMLCNLELYALYPFGTLFRFGYFFP